MPMRYRNGLGIGILALIMAVTPLVPVAVSAPPPQWVWDADGRVSDATGQYRVLTEEEACTMYGFCKQPIKRDFSTSVASTSDGGGGDSSGGGGC